MLIDAIQFLRVLLILGLKSLRVTGLGFKMYTFDLLRYF